MDIASHVQRVRGQRPDAYIAARQNERAAPGAIRLIPETKIPAFREGPAIAFHGDGKHLPAVRVQQTECRLVGLSKEGDVPRLRSAICILPPEGSGCHHVQLPEWRSRANANTAVAPCGEPRVALDLEVLGPCHCADDRHGRGQYERRLGLRREPHRSSSRPPPGIALRPVARLTRVDDTASRAAEDLTRAGCRCGWNEATSSEPGQLRSCPGALDVRDRWVPST